MPASKAQAPRTHETARVSAVLLSALRCHVLPANVRSQRRRDRGVQHAKDANPASAALRWFDSSLLAIWPPSLNESDLRNFPD